MSEVAPISEPSGEVVVYEAPDGGARVEVVVGEDTVWLSQRQMADLFETSTDNVGLHIRNAYAEGELEEVATAEESSVVRSEGGRQVRRRVRRYNLDVIISVGYLRRNNELFGTHGQPRFSNTALVALALLVAESQASHKDLVIRLILNLLAEDRP